MPLVTQAAETTLAGYHYHFPHGVRGDLLMKMGWFPEAREEIQRAIGMTRNLREQELKERLKQRNKAAQSTYLPLRPVNSAYRHPLETCRQFRTSRLGPIESLIPC